jgi:hypothetical protein
MSDTTSFDVLKADFDAKLAQSPFQDATDYNAAYKLIASIYKVSSTRPITLHDMAAEVARIQSVSDRLTDVYADIYRNHILRKQAFDILSKAFTKYSKESAQDKRRGDSYAHLHQYGSAAAEAEALFVYCNAKMQNLEKQYESVSRMITCLQRSMNFSRIDASLDESYGSEKSEETAPQIGDW